MQGSQELVERPDRLKHSLFVLTAAYSKKSPCTYTQNPILRAPAQHLLFPETPLHLNEGIIIVGSLKGLGFRDLGFRLGLDGLEFRVVSFTTL